MSVPCKRAHGRRFFKSFYFYPPAASFFAPAALPKKNRLRASAATQTNGGGGGRCHLKLDLEITLRSFFLFFFSQAVTNARKQFFSCFFGGVFFVFFLQIATMNFHFGTGEAHKPLGSLPRGG